MMRPRLDILTLMPAGSDPAGDASNTAILLRRAEWEGVDARQAPTNSSMTGRGVRPDLVVLCSGPEEALVDVTTTISEYAARLREWMAAGTIVVAIGLSWQCLAARVQFGEGDLREGAGLLSGESLLLPRRVSGDLVVDSPWGVLVGFENHGRRYALGPKERSIGRVLHGVGDAFGVEGVLTGGLVGCNFHGPLLAKNPLLADDLLRSALAARHDLPFVPGSAERQYADSMAIIARARVIDQADRDAAWRRHPRDPVLAEIVTDGK